LLSKELKCGCGLLPDIDKISESNSTTIKFSDLVLCQEAHLTPQSLQRSQLEKKSSYLRHPCSVFYLGTGQLLILTTAVSVALLKEYKAASEGKRS
jgi:hypothetical protein